MLYDPKWEKQAETRADPLTLAALVAWLETKSPQQQYCYDDHGRCLAAQYNASIGRKYSVPLGNMILPKSEWSFDDKLEHIAVNEPRTFGAALERAREIAQG